jgi:hypothetical protein
MTHSANDCLKFDEETQTPLRAKKMKAKPNKNKMEKKLVTTDITIKILNWNVNGM